MHDATGRFHSATFVRPSVVPIYARRARIVDGEGLFTGIVGKSYADLAKLAKCHKNTISPCLNGEPKQYNKAHDIFTALNMLSGNAFPREIHVEYYSKQAGDYLKDYTLSDTFVLPCADDILKRHKIKLQQISDDTNIELINVQQVIVGRRPVARNISEVIFDFLLKIEPSLSRNENLIR
jgi:hypothetical protein